MDVLVTADLITKPSQLGMAKILFCFILRYVPRLDTFSKLPCVKSDAVFGDPYICFFSFLVG